MLPHKGNNFFFLLFGLLITLLLMPVGWNRFDGIVTLAFTGTLVVSVWSLARTKWAYYVGLALAVISVMNSAIELGTDWREFATVSIGVPFAFCLLSMMIALRGVVVQTGVDANRIAGAVSVYLLLGLNWAFVFGFLLMADPGALTGIDVATGKSFLDLLYYSFVTLTTLGYGDIAPVSPVARALAYLEAVSGVMYVAILVASLVGSIGGPRDRSNEGQR
jgi:hypothetical protein